MSYTFSGLACGTIGFTGCDLRKVMQHEEDVSLHMVLHDFLPWSMNSVFCSFVQIISVLS